MIMVLAPHKNAKVARASRDAGAAEPETAG